MSNYTKDFVGSYGIAFYEAKKNHEALKQAAHAWSRIRAQTHLTGDSIVMLCGAKNNGKSALARLLVNDHVFRLLDELKEAPQAQQAVQTIDEESKMTDDPHQTAPASAYYVDFDPGQPEMTTPGLVSAHIIRSDDAPLVSPTYLNVLKHEPIAMSSVGGTNMSVNPKMYIDNCRLVMDKLKEHQAKQDAKQPIVINTMGFIRNVGLALLMDLIKICRPTNLIVLNIETDAMRTIYADLSPASIEGMPASFFYETSQQAKGLNYKYDVHNLQFSFIDSADIATKNRTALQIAYFASMPEALYKPVMQMSPRWVSFEKTAVFCVSSYPLKEAIILDLLYHSWIHLVNTKRISPGAPEPRQQPGDSGGQEAQASDPLVCTILDEVRKNLVIGCGIVADVDLQKRRLAVITPLSQETIDQEVNCVIKPLSIQVPSQFLQTPG